MSFRPSAHASFSANDRNGLTRRTVLFWRSDRWRFGSSRMRFQQGYSPHRYRRHFLRLPERLRLPLGVCVGFAF